MFLYRHKALNGVIIMNFKVVVFREKMEEAHLLNEALEDVKEGRVVDGKEALLQLKEKYDL